ncbi:PREDICTED: uncharacterized protein LOC104596993 [Nelumbo nucifera]|uniref:Uncharacterized protein n=2 Tax=Nelumbo nucifera TaxID=4432 RepID=A0A822Y1Z8_NELNU|nr:PREDICTED: uncharacterized protein LOC104596993 [Nelumbo nucifera]DAD26640.1 TPA_asm: hypothetical protein HUJ06_028108 [Nelumbo nucifera]
MPLDAMEMVVVIRNLISSISASCRWVRNHPLILGVVIFLYFLYRFLPSLFGFLLSSSPILVCTAVLLGTFFNFGTNNIPKDEDGTNRTSQVGSLKGAGGKDHSSSAGTDKDNRRDFEGKTVRRIDLSKRIAGDKGRKTVFTSVRTNRSIIFSEEKPKDVNKEAIKEERNNQEKESKSLKLEPTGEFSFESSRDSSSKQMEDRVDELDPLSRSFDAASEKSSEDSTALEEIESQEETEDAQRAQEDGSKAVEWTEDDQKNLMDLGTSELERNQRLENLIAKRRARKLLRMEAEKNLIDFDSNDLPVQIPPISTIRTNPFDLPYCPNDTTGLPPIPGSAPSVLLPSQNPFDLPYDPLEEKPNLMEDNFQEEFMAAQPKDFFFCRHESFSLGPSFPLPCEPRQNMRDLKFPPFFVPQRMPPEKATHFPPFPGQSLGARSAPDSSGEESQSSEEEADSIEINDQASKTDNLGMSSPQITKENIKPTIGGVAEESSNSMQPSLRDSYHMGLQVADEVYDSRVNEQPVYDSSPSATEKMTIEEALLNVKKRGHEHHTQSIASDLQVEVSEVGSPMSIVSMSDGKSLLNERSIPDDDTSSIDELASWSASSHLRDVDEIESRSKGVSMISERDVIKVGFMGLSRSSKDLTIGIAPLPPPAPDELDFEDGSVDTITPPSPNPMTEAAANEGSMDHEKTQPPKDNSTVQLSRHAGPEKQKVNERPTLINTDVKQEESVLPRSSEDGIVHKNTNESVVKETEKDGSKSTKAIEDDSDNKNVKPAEPKEGDIRHEAEVKKPVTEATLKETTPKEEAAGPAMSQLLKEQNLTRTGSEPRVP